MSVLVAVGLVVVGLYVAAKVVKFTLKALLIGGVAAFIYLVVVPEVQRLVS